MKKLIPLLALLIGVTSAVAQVGTVTFNNNTLGGTGRPVFMPDGSTPVVGTNFLAQLYYGAVGTPEASLTAVTTAAARFRPTGVNPPGTWLGGTRTLTGFGPGQTVLLQVRVTDVSSSLIGSSLTFTYTVPAVGSPPAAFDMANFQSFSLVPEPSVIGLGLIGAGALFLLRRRK
jgi:hypothetical protein